MLGGGQPGAALQILKHAGVCGHEVGCIQVAHQDSKEHQVRGAEPGVWPPLWDSWSTWAGPHTCPPSHPGLPYQAGQGHTLQGSPLVRQVGQQLRVPLGGAACEGPAVSFPHLCQAVGGSGGWQEGRAQLGVLWGGPVSPGLQGRRAQPAPAQTRGYSLVEEQQVGGVECEVILEAMPGGQVGQAAELGRAGGCHFLTGLGPAHPLPHQVSKGPPWPALCHLDLVSSSPRPPQHQGQPWGTVKPGWNPRPTASRPSCPPPAPCTAAAHRGPVYTNATPASTCLTWPALGLFQIYY